MYFCFNFYDSLNNKLINMRSLHMNAGTDKRTTAWSGPPSTKRTPPTSIPDPSTSTQMPSKYKHSRYNIPANFYDLFEYQATLDI